MASFPKAIRKMFDDSFDRTALIGEKQVCLQRDKLVVQPNYLLSYNLFLLRRLAEAEILL